MIATFYSLTADPVRTGLLRLAASALDAEGYGVLVVDFDVEYRRLSAERDDQPSVHEILGHGLGEDSWRAHLGGSPSWASAHTLAVGLRSDPGWERVFVELDGGSRIETMRDEWLAAYDFVLVDSAPGMGHASGVATIQLADVVIVCVESSAESVRDVEAVVDQIQRGRQNFDFDRPPATIIPIPVQPSTPDSEADRTSAKLAHYCGSWLSRSASAENSLQSLTVFQAEADDRLLGVADNVAKILTSVWARRGDTTLSVGAVDPSHSATAVRPLTAEDVRNVAFRKPPIGKRGYDEEEVDIFLDEVERQVARLIDENSDLRAQQPNLRIQIDNLLREKAAAEQTARQLQIELDRVRSSGAAIQLHPAEIEPHALRVLMVAQQTADTHVLDARGRADAVLSKAIAQAEEVTRKARTEADSLERSARQRFDETMGGLEAKRTALQEHIEVLRRFEREYRTRLRSYLESQLRALERGGASELSHPVATRGNVTDGSGLTVSSANQGPLAGEGARR